jgi:dihydroorotate dehydrogenase electron transfer subunit
MRRPLSIQRVDAAAGWIEVLYKVMGQGLAALRAVPVGGHLSVLGPIGQGFKPDTQRPRAVLLGGGVGIPPLLFLAESLVAGGTPPDRVVAFFGSELPFPCVTAKAQLAVAGAPAGASHSLPELERLGVGVRLASQSDLPGCHRGFVTDLARHWLAQQSAAALQEITIYSCGPTPMLKAVQALAREFALPTQLCLEEFMACAVGGCAGCAVPVLVDGQRAMKRVCVDGPVFAGAAVYPD